MKSILLIFTVFFNTLAQADTQSFLFTCGDHTFSYDEITVTEQQDTFNIYINSGYNQSLYLNPFLGKQAMSGRGTIIVSKADCLLSKDNPNLLFCEKADLDLNVRLENRPKSIDPIEIIEKLQGSVMLLQVVKSGLSSTGEIVTSRSAELSVVTNHENFERRSLGAQVSCERQAF